MSHIHQKYTLKNNDDNDFANSEEDAIYRENGNNKKKDESKIEFQNKTIKKLNSDKESKDDKLTN
jgi:hypothetical protein